VRRVFKLWGLCLMVTAGVLLAPAPQTLRAEEIAKTSPCANLPHTDHPRVTLRRGKMEAVIFLIDKDNGYYRATRFDWSGVVACVAVNGHKFFGEWFAKYDPLKNDSITGPVEEFRTDNGVMGHYPPTSPLTTIHTEAIGYNEAKPGETFLKPGVGMLRKVDDRPYASGSLYPIVDGGTWTTKKTRSSISFQQVLNGQNGYGYIYTKTLSLDANGMGMTLHHTLKNTGTKVIDTKVYDHDFFVFDDKPAEPGMVVRFKFRPRPVDPMTDMVQIEGNEIQFQRAVKPRESINAYIVGYSDRSSDYDITVEDANRKIGVEQTSDSPISRILFWTNGTAVCPEVYLHVPAAPGKMSQWMIHYRFFAPAP
jgi:hypothetical protein